MADVLFFPPRKKVARSFIVARATSGVDTSCPVCGLRIEVGQRARYRPDGALVHHRHHRTPNGEIVNRRVHHPSMTCPTCHLTKPCDCEA